MAINKAMILGNVGKDPEVRDAGGVKVASFTMATTEKGYTKRDGMQVPERTEWHNIVCWRGLADIVEKYVRKGTKLFIEGKICTRSWQDQQGQKRYTTEIIAENMELLGSPQQRPTEQQAVNNLYGYQPQPQQPQQQFKAPWE